MKMVYGENNTIVTDMEYLFKSVNGGNENKYNKWLRATNEMDSDEKIEVLRNLITKNTMFGTRIIDSEISINDNNVILSMQEPFDNGKLQMDLTDFICFIQYTAVESEEDMILMKLEDYSKGNFENSTHTKGEAVWKSLEDLISLDYNSMEKHFKGLEWEDNYNTAIANINNKSYAILRA